MPFAVPLPTPSPVPSLGDLMPSTNKQPQTITIGGEMTFDVDDIAGLEGNGNSFYQVILHEMGHVIGIG